VPARGRQATCRKRFRSRSPRTDRRARGWRPPLGAAKVGQCCGPAGRRRRPDGPTMASESMRHCGRAIAQRAVRGRPAGERRPAGPVVATNPLRRRHDPAVVDPQGQSRIYAAATPHTRRTRPRGKIDLEEMGQLLIGSCPISSRSTLWGRAQGWDVRSSGPRPAGRLPGE
jgi:hypothetical protein